MKSLRLETLRTYTPAGRDALGLSVNGSVVLRLALDGQKRANIERKLALAASRLLAGARQGKRSPAAEPAPGGRYWLLRLGDADLLAATDREALHWNCANAEELARLWAGALALALANEPAAEHQARAAAEELASGSSPNFKRSAPVPAGTRHEGAQDQAPGKLSTTEEEKEDERDPAARTQVSAFLRPSLQPRREPERQAGTGYIAGALPVFIPPGAALAPLLTAPAALTAQVTGNPASEEAVKQALSQALRSHLRLGPLDSLSWALREPDADTRGRNGRKDTAPKQVAPSPAPDLSLGRGLRKRLRLDYSAGALNGTAEVVLENLTLTPPAESMTMFSNNPEGLSRQQLLYRATLPGRHASRLVFHHQNQSGLPLYQIARVVNSGNESQLVHILPGTCEPDANTYWVGFASAEDFLGNTARNSGWVAQIPPGGSTVLSGQRLAPGATSSGYFKLTSLSRGDLSIETLAILPDSQLPSGPWPGEPASACVFGPPYIEASATHTVGGDWTYLRLGAESPLCQLGSGARLWGCYGMTHDFDVTLANPPGSGLSTVYVILRGSAGEVKGQAIIDGRYKSTPLAPSGGEELLETLAIQPGETRRLKVSAIALNGGFYPASIILRETRDP